MTEDDDKKVKDLIDAATRAELEKWFGLPSFTEVAEGAAQPAAPVEDPDVVAVRERRERAIAAVDPAMLEAHRRRVEPPDDLIKFKPVIDVHIDPEVALFDHGMVDRAASIAEPREVELSEQLLDDLKECTPQALLRDLHRPELDFEKTFEVVDMAAEQRLDVVAAVAEAMSTRWTLPPVEVSSWREGRAVLAELRASRHASWTSDLARLPNRRVQD